MEYQKQFEDVVIGVYVLKEARAFERQLGVAAYHCSVLVQPGQYPIKARLLLACLMPHIEMASPEIHLPGVIVSSAYPSLYGGVHYSSNLNTDVGQPSGTVLQPYTYDIVHLVLSGKETPYQLFDEYEAREDGIFPREMTAKEKAHDLGAAA